MKRISQFYDERGARSAPTKQSQAFINPPGVKIVFHHDIILCSSTGNVSQELMFCFQPQQSENQFEHGIFIYLYFQTHNNNNTS